MFRKTTRVAHLVLTVAAVFASVFHPPAVASSSPAGLEFPVTMRQSVAAGKTPVGTKVQANLTVATLVDRVVIPEGAILSGEVTESVAKSKTGPSRLAIRMDLARWKNGSTPIKVYLTAWYFPAELTAAQGLPFDPQDPSLGRRTDVNGPTTRRSPQPPQPTFPDQNSGLDVPDTSSTTSKHRTLMKDVSVTRSPYGAVTLTSLRFNIKIDKTTTYVLATGDLLPAK
jgi:hypothetical protein